MKTGPDCTKKKRAMSSIKLSYTFSETRKCLTFILCHCRHDDLFSHNSQGHKNWKGLQAPVLNPGRYGGPRRYFRDNFQNINCRAAPCPELWDWGQVRASIRDQACMCHAAEPYPALSKPGKQEPFSDPGGSGRPNSAYTIKVPLTPLKVPLRACKPGHLERWIGAFNGVYKIRGAKMICLYALRHKHSNSTPNYLGHYDIDYIGESSKRSKARKPFPFWRLLVKAADDDPNLTHRCLFCRWCRFGTASGLTNILCPWPMPCVRQGHGYEIFACIKSRVRLMHEKFNMSSSSSSTVAWTLANGPSPAGVCTAWTSAHGPAPYGVHGAWSLASPKGPAVPYRCGPGNPSVCVCVPLNAVTRDV